MLVIFLIRVNDEAKHEPKMCSPIVNFNGAKGKSTCLFYIDSTRRKIKDKEVVNEGVVKTLILKKDK